MMRPLILLSFVVSASAATAGDPAWVGYWSPNNGWCKHAGSVGDETPDYYDTTGLFGLEWSCDITSMTEIGVGQSWHLELTCLDAGFEYTSSNIFVITHMDRLLIIDDTGESTDMVRCEKEGE